MAFDKEHTVNRQVIALLSFTGAVLIIVGMYVHRNDPPCDPVNAQAYIDTMRVLEKELQHTTAPSVMGTRCLAALDSVEKYSGRAMTEERDGINRMFGDAMQDSVRQAMW